jgi:hypothetical protein
MSELKPATAAVPGSAMVFKLLGDYFTHPIINDGIVADEWWIQSARDKSESYGPFNDQYKAVGEMMRMVEEDRRSKR